LPIALAITLAAALVGVASHEAHRLSLHPLLALIAGLLTAYAGTAVALCATRPGRRIIRNAGRAAQAIGTGVFRTGRTKPSIHPATV
jgi:hypothetical protein